ncbi:hypothetical protein GCM10025868_35230 [Angustibacter aerolatus]|uniref:Uncharacterized protein n=1 Tax=Angustibacter aerolatus TaxID=1162965 RepID=A0ABQ6JJ89_9ACTN|nr:hypothetical protein GCM10025868_35230 [Angustibacter aerolatus]
MVLTMVLTPTIEPGGQRQTASLFDVFNQHVITPTLVDPVNLKQYRVVSGYSALQSDPTGVSASSGQPMFAYAVFAAPQDPIDAIDVQVADSLPRFTDVPIR